MLIPFGFKDGKYLDISEVERGRACACVCPSCKQNLVAKKGPNPEKMIHHFAHDKKSKEQQGDTIECKYSFCVVARLVIKQCLRELSQLEIQLPEWKLLLTKQDKYGRQVSVSGLVTRAHVLNIDDFEVEPNPPLSELDVLCCVNGYAFGIHFSYQGRSMIDSNRYEDISVVDINLEPLQLLYATYEHETHESFKSLVMDYVLNSGQRHWVAHARYMAIHRALSQKLNEMLEESDRNPPVKTLRKSAVETVKHKPYKKLRKARAAVPNAKVTTREEGQPCVRCGQQKSGYIDNLICAPCLQKYYSEGIFHTGAIKKVVLSTYF
ncbi:hypothetical protein RJD40_08235 [Vibrio scophthalmi]|uniref:competence protein CoiA family protein n=1 Tax=Vibrio TaxID=662 RepID=UPI0037350E8A